MSLSALVGIKPDTIRHWMTVLSHPLLNLWFFKNPRPLTVNHLKVYWRPSWLILDWITGKYEPGTTLIMDHLVHPGMAVVDIGANIGYYTLLLAQSVGLAGRVYAFEPDPPNLELLRKNVAANGFQNVVTVVPLACGAQSGTTTFSNSTFYGQKGKKAAVIEVKVVSLDDYFSSIGWPQVDLIKMDIEGAEKAALDGMLQLSQKNPQLNIILEFNPFMMQQAGVTRAGFFDSLLSLGFANFWVIKNELKGEKYLVELHIPRDIDRLTREFADGTEVNLLCAKPEKMVMVNLLINNKTSKSKN